MSGLEIALLGAALVAIVLAFLGWMRNAPESGALLDAKQAELAAKDGLIEQLRQEILQLQTARIKAERLGEVEIELAGLRRERDELRQHALEAEALARRVEELQERLTRATTQIEGLQQTLASKDESIRLAELRATGAESERDRIRAEGEALKTSGSAQQEQIVSLTRDLEMVRGELEKEKSLHAENMKLLKSAEQSFRDAFGNLSSEALQRNNAAFLNLAAETFKGLQTTAQQDMEAREKAIASLIDPVKATLTKFDTQVQELEKNRATAYTSLTTQLGELARTQDYLRQETGNLVKALRAPQVRGRWGELTLKRAVEMAGMLDHCDFLEQDSTDTEEGRLRPDMIIRLPGNRKIVVDAKVPLAAYLEALEAPDEDTKKLHLQEHARQLRDHITKLGRKNYWDQYKNESPEFVVLFIPGEVFYSAALEADPQLIELATSEKVMLASPSNLIPLLRAVHYGWKQEAIAGNAQLISNLGKELYERIGMLAKHWTGVGRHLKQAIEAYNSSVGTLETRVLVSARRFQELKVTKSDGALDTPEPIDVALRDMTSTEMLAVPEKVEAE